MMKETGLLMKGPMVRAILDGTKTMTRRVIKPQPPVGAVWDEGAKLFALPGSSLGVMRNCPYGQVGDLLYVRELLREVNGVWFYDADKAPVIVATSDVLAMVTWAHHKEQDYCSSMFMPKWACRIWLEITGVRVERVQEISINDAFFEGTESIMPYLRGDGPWDDPYVLRYFKELWDSINAKRGYGWDANCWLWVLNFKRLTP
ncbi:MAG: hypothetical protein V3S51_07280 [Dehalococcoidia bacterium]